jgi:hypothetical protein
MPVRALVAPLLALALAAGLAGCESLGLDIPKGSDSILAAFSGPSPSDAAAWSTDPNSADKRYRGTLLLANAPWAGEPVYLALYEDAAKDPDASVRTAGIRALALHGNPSHVAIILQHLSLKDEPDRLVRVEAARALQRLHDTSAIEPLIQALRPPTRHLVGERWIDEPNEPDAGVRAQAAEALGQYPERRVAQALIVALHDGNLSVNYSSLRSLRTLTGQDFGYDTALWQDWFKAAPDTFAARSTYIYPVFQRPKRFYEYIPFFPPPPNESPAAPVGVMAAENK